MNVGIEKKAKPTYKVGDKVRIVDKFPHGINPNSRVNSFLGTIMTIEKATPYYYNMREDDGHYFWYDQDIVGIAKVERTSDLMSGDIIALRNGKRYFVIDNLRGATSGTDWLDLTLYDDDMTCGCCMDDFDIVKVARPNMMSQCVFGSLNSKDCLVYERKDPEEMTLSEVCKLLGKQIKIILEKE